MKDSIYIYIYIYNVIYFIQLFQLDFTIYIANKTQGDKIWYRTVLLWI